MTTTAPAMPAAEKVHLAERGTQPSVTLPALQRQLPARHVFVGWWMHRAAELRPCMAVRARLQACKTDRPRVLRSWHRGRASGAAEPTHATCVPAWAPGCIGPRRSAGHHMVRSGEGAGAPRFAWRCKKRRFRLGQGFRAQGRPDAALQEAAVVPLSCQPAPGQSSHLNEGCVFVGNSGRRSSLDTLTATSMVRRPLYGRMPVYSSHIMMPNANTSTARVSLPLGCMASGARCVMVPSACLLKYELSLTMLDSPKSATCSTRRYTCRARR